MNFRDIFDGLLVALVLALMVGLYSVAGTSDYRAALETERRIATINASRELRPCDHQWIRQTSPGDESFRCVDADLRNEKRGAAPHILSVPCNHDGERCR